MLDERKAIYLCLAHMSEAGERALTSMIFIPNRVAA